MIEVRDEDQDYGVEKLLPHERSVLLHIWDRFAGQSFDDDKLRSLHVHRLSGVEVQVSFLSLRKQGWIHAVKKGWGERLYFIPFTRLRSLQACFGNLDAKHAAPEGVRLLQEGKNGIAIDMFNVLVYLAKNDVAITSKGVLHKKHIQRLGHVVTLSRSDVEGLHLQYSHHEVYPPQVAVVLDLLLSMELVTADSGALRLNMDALQHWLALPREVVEGLILTDMMKRYVPPIPSYQHFTWRICDSSLTCGTWFAAAQFLPRSADGPEEVQSSGRNLPVEDVIPWLQLLAGCGYIDLGMNDRDEMLLSWRMNPYLLLSGRTPEVLLSGRLFIQPDFEILIPPDVPCTVKFMAAKCSERVSDDLMTVYRLTRDSMAQAAEAGMGPEQVISFLEEHAAAGVPENIYAALRQWGKEIAGPQIPDMMIQTGMASAEEGDLLNHAVLLNRYVMSRYDFTQSNGLISSNRREIFLERDDSLPEIGAVLPDLDRIPVMWTRDWRAYHSSTAKQMMEQALEISAKLEISVNGSRMEFIPFRLVRQPWKITGALYEPDSDKSGIPVQLTAGEWKEMRLVIPESV